MKRPHIVAAIVFAVLAIVWNLWLGPRWTHRVPRDSVSTTQYFGTQTNADATTGLLPNQDVLSIYDRTIRVVDDTDWPRSVVVQDKYTARDSETGVVVFEHITNERVDPRTGAWFEGPYKGHIVFFPRNVQQRTYVMRSNYVQGLPLKFSGVHDIRGLKVYLFSYRGPIEYTAAFTGTAESPGVSVTAGQEIRCADDQFYYRALVEPRTGRVAQLEEGCPSGDFIYDKVTGNKVAAVDRWNGVTSGAALDAGISDIYAARYEYFWALYFPAFLLAGSIVALAAGVSRRNDGAFA